MPIYRASTLFLFVASFASDVSAQVSGRLQTAGRCVSAGSGEAGRSVLYGTTRDGLQSDPQDYCVIDQGTGQATLLGGIDLTAPLGFATDWRPASFRAWIANYDVQTDLSSLERIDLETGLVTHVGTFASRNPVYELAFDVAGDRLVATTRTDGLLFEVDPDTATMSFLSEPGLGILSGLEFAADGRLFAFTPLEGFFEVNADTGEATAIGQVDVSAPVDLAIRPEDGVAFVSDTNLDEIRTLDLTSGTTTVVGPYGAGISTLVGLAFGPPEPITLSFETEDDFATPLVNGQDISIDSEFGAWVAVSGFGPNLGAAIFDSSPTGPNSAGSDPDLLVDQGNLLILQDVTAGAQSSAGVFDLPNDARLGGTLRFDFVAPVTVYSIDLVDICPGAQNAFVTLTDVSQRARTYHCPGGWTKDIAQSGPPGVGRLDLLTTVEQAGVSASATSMQQVGFDPLSVVCLEVHFQASGAVDNVVFVPRDQR